jgi:hypothetical protein
MDVVSELKQSTIETVALLCGVILVATLVRAVPFLKLLYRSKGERVSVCSSQMKQLLLDISYFFLSLFVILSIYRAIPFLAKTMNELYIYRRATPVRKVVEEYVELVASDLGAILSLFNAWRNYKVMLAIAVWGALTPAHMIFMVLPRRIGGDRFKTFLSTMIWFCIICLVIAQVFALPDPSTTNSHTRNHDITVCQGLLLACLIAFTMFAVAAFRHDPELRSIKSPTREIHWSWENFFAFADAIIAPLQLCVLTLQLGVNQDAENGSISRYAQHTQEQLDSIVFWNFDFGVDQINWSLGLAVAVTVIWFFLTSAPVCYCYCWTSFNISHFLPFVAGGH